MNKYIAVILALERSGKLNNDEYRPYLAQIPVAGRPMLEWVIRSLRASEKISGVIVLGPDQINELYCSRMIDIQKNNYNVTIEELIKLLPQKIITSERLIDLSPQNHYIIVNTTSILISPAHINKIINDFEEISQPMAVLATNTEKIIQERFLPSFVFKINGKSFAPTGVVLIKNAIMFNSAISKLNNILDYKTKSKTIVENNAPPTQWFDPNEKELCHLLLSSHFQTAVLVTTRHELNLAADKLHTQRPLSRRKNCVLIMNPFSGSGSIIPRQMKTLTGLKPRSFEQGKNPELLSIQIKNYLKEYGFNPEIHLTKSSEDAGGFAKYCVKNHREMVIAAGGDGTINAVVNGLATSDVVFGIIPLGTVNLLATELDIPPDIRSSCQLLAEGNIRRMDLGMINEWYFASLASIGFDAYVMKKTKPRLKRLLGALAFIFSAMRIITSYPFKSIRIKIDHETGERKGYLLVIGNGKFFSANMPVAPHARIDDHKLDLVLYKRHNLAGILSYFREIKAGNIVQSPYTDYLQVERVSVLAHGHHLVQGDGEIFGTTPVTIQVAPSALKIIC